MRNRGRNGVTGFVVAAFAAATVVAAVMTPSGDPAAAAGAAHQPHLERGGQMVEVIDGATLRIDGQEIALAGVAAPAVEQQCAKDGRFEPCGEQASAALAKIVTLSVKQLQCSATEGGDTYVCSVEGRDLAEALVSQGRVLARGERYAATEHQARKAGLGLWGMTFVPPEQWRDGVRLPGEEAAAQDRATERQDAAGETAEH